MNEHDVPILRPPTELSAVTLPLFARVTAGYLEGPSTVLVLDLGGVRSITSAGLSHLVLIGRRLGERGGQLALAGGNRGVVRLLETIGLDAVMPHFRTVDEAVEHLRRHVQS